jgi:hypothetical protein
MSTDGVELRTADISSMNTARREEPISPRRFRWSMQSGRALPVSLTLLGAAAVFALVLVLSRDGERPAIANTAETPGVATLVTPADVNSGERAARSQAETTAAQVQPAATVRADPNAEPHEAPPVAAEFPVYDASATQLDPVHQMPAEVSGAVDANARASALRQIGSASSSDSLPLLEQTLLGDTVARNRLLAVNALRLLGKRVENVERVRHALRAAMSDADQNVAASARDAYDELAR